MKPTRLLIFVLLVLSSLGAQAQKVTFRASAPLTVEAGERFRVEYRLEGTMNADFRGPTFTGCDVLAGPTMASGSSTTIVNGAQSSSVYQIFTYVVQASATAQKVTVTAAQASLDGKSYNSNPLSINVVAAGSGGATGGGAGASSGFNPSTTTQKVAADDVVLRMSLSKNSVYKGEAIVATLKLYMRVGVSNLQKPKYPTFNGFWTQELDLTGAQPKRETLGDKVYEVQPLRQWLLYPQKSGTLEVEQSSFTALVQVITRSTGSSLFDNFMGGGSRVENVEKLLTTPPIKVQVKDLPKQGAPLDFSLAVGKFSLKSEFSGSEITANSAGYVRVTLSGTGDFPLIETPTFKLPAAFEQYDTKTSEQLTSSVGGTTGSRTWEFPFIARAEGDYTLPPIEMSYFDPSTGGYKTLRTEAYKLKVLRDPSGGKNSAAVVAGVSKEDLKVVGSDVRHIKRGDLGLSSSDDTVLFSVGYFVWLMVALGLFVAALVLLKKQIARRADVTGRAKRKASKVALARLRKARTLLEAADRAAFFEETLRALWGYVGDKFALPTSELNKQTIRAQFADRGVTDEVADEFVQIVEDSELARYAPTGEVSMQELYDRALSIIDKIE